MGQTQLQRTGFANKSLRTNTHAHAVEEREREKNKGHVNLDTYRRIKGNLLFRTVKNMQSVAFSVSVYRC